MRSNKQKRYDEEFKSSAVKMVIEKGRTISDVSKSLDVSEPALRRWVTVAKEPESSENSMWIHQRKGNDTYSSRVYS